MRIAALVCGWKTQKVIHCHHICARGGTLDSPGIHLKTCTCEESSGSLHAALLPPIFRTLRACSSLRLGGSSVRSFLLMSNLSRLLRLPIEAGNAVSLLQLRFRLVRFFRRSRAKLRRQIQGSPTFSQMMFVQMRSDDAAKFSSCVHTLPFHTLHPGNAPASDCSVSIQGETDFASRYLDQIRRSECS